jgi:FAD/FMN-containing dehydrogenase
MTTETLEEPGMTAARQLRGTMRGRVVTPGDDGYEGCLNIFNGAVQHRPALIAICETREDVKAAVLAAHAHRLRLSVRGGGHDWAGRCLRHDGLVIDLTAMRQVKIDPAARIATVAGGATAHDVIAAAAPHGLVAVTGNCGSVGMAGLTLGGGYGPLGSRFGLALDNLLGVEMVLADGRRITADASDYPDLFWALRGGGGNFGVVTSMRVRLHPVRELQAGLILFPWPEAATVLSGYARIAGLIADELGATLGVLAAPDGGPLLFLAPVWCGDAVEGEHVMDTLRGLGTPIMSRIGPMAYAEFLALFDAAAVDGRHYDIKTRWLSELTPEVIAALVAACSGRTSPLSMIALHHFRGRATRVAANDTAFATRREHFMLEAIAAWEPGDEQNSAAHRQWVRELSTRLAPYALPGGYANMLGPNDHDQIAQAYGGNIDRLRNIKRRFDPNSVFSAIPLPDTAPGQRLPDQRSLG